MPECPLPLKDAPCIAPVDGSIVSVTRFRARSLWVLPLFALHAHRSIAQLRAADGYIAGAVRQDIGLALWTMTLWRDHGAVRAYVASGAHRRAMPLLRTWGEEAGVVRWAQDQVELPDWTMAEHRLRQAGHAVPLNRPGSAHGDLSFAERPIRYSGRL